MEFIVVVCLNLFVLAKLSAVASSRPHFGNKHTKIRAKCFAATKVDQASVPEKSQFPRVSHFVRLSSLVRVLRRNRKIPNWYKGGNMI